MQVILVAPGTFNLGCFVGAFSGTSTTCSSGASTIQIPAATELSLEIHINGPVSPHDVLFGWRAVFSAE